MDKSFFLSSVYEQLLVGDRDNPIGLFHLEKASAAQICRARRYSPDSIKRVKALLHTLVKHGYVLFDKRPTTDYRSPYYYVLANRGIEYIKSIGYTVSKSYQPTKEIGQSYLHLLHKLGVNDVLISAALLKWEVPGYHLAAFKLERDLAKDPFHTFWHGETRGQVPDVFLDLRHLLDNGQQERTPVFVEFDRGSEQEDVIRWKAHAYATMLSTGWYREQFNIKSISVVFVSFQGEGRREELRGWIREELRSEDRAVVSSFLVATWQQPPEARVWCLPCFYTPFVEAKPVAVLGEGCQ